MPSVAQGGEVTLTALYRNGLGQPADAEPGSVAVQLRDPLGAVVYGPFGVPPVVDEAGVGNYSYAFTAAGDEDLGTWSVEWSGIVQGAQVTGIEYLEVVLPGSIATGPLDFLIKPDDYNAIRNAMGLEGSELDITDEEIERILFAPQAEQRVKNRISNWADQMLDPDRLFVLRMATAYATAALMSESIAKGGTIGRVYPTDRGAWSGVAEIFWQRHEEWLAMAEAYDVQSDSSFSIGLLRASGPTKALRLETDVPPWVNGWSTRWGGWTHG